jgi:hypothetical protein
MKGSSSACTAIVVRRTAAGKVLRSARNSDLRRVPTRHTICRRLQCARQCAQTRPKIGDRRFAARRAHLAQILQLLAEDSRLNIYAGELEVRPPSGRMKAGRGRQILGRPPTDRWHISSKHVMMGFARSIGDDVRHAVRLWWKSPGLSLTVLTSLTLGDGSTVNAY